MAAAVVVVSVGDSGGDRLAKHTAVRSAGSALGDLQGPPAARHHSSAAPTEVCGCVATAQRGFSIILYLYHDLLVASLSIFKKTILCTAVSAAGGCCD
jgi:hypothetical protein